MNCSSLTSACRHRMAPRWSFWMECLPLTRCLPGAARWRRREPCRLVCPGERHVSRQEAEEFLEKLSALPAEKERGPSPVRRVAARLTAPQYTHIIVQEATS